ncbi:hypothetical protein GE09DRAFT_1101100 [Coniochaeta sp. 2T2.1]|nr:hypothetical protein GE09DRAFT_1101100 [Coniochaeta sp. 2T2.1]
MHSAWNFLIFVCFVGRGDVWRLWPLGQHDCGVQDADVGETWAARVAIRDTFLFLLRPPAAICIAATPLSTSCSVQVVPMRADTYSELASNQSQSALNWTGLILL